MSLLLQVVILFFFVTLSPLILYCCSLIVAPHRFLQVRGNYTRCILWYIVCVVVSPINMKGVHPS